MQNHSRQSPGLTGFFLLVPFILVPCILGCESGEFQCSNGRCVPQSLRCDAEDDCKDNSDEKSCNNFCDGFRCGDGICIPSEWLCDQDIDCGDKSDEADCNNNNRCRNDQSQCSDGRCIPSRWLCDHEDDCGDGSDEFGCILPNCASDQFQCGNGTCINSGFYCDSINHCGDNSDEQGCGFPSGNRSSSQFHGENESRLVYLICFATILFVKCVIGTR